MNPADSQLSTIREVKDHSFIFEKKNALSHEWCVDIINRFEESEDEQYRGQIGQTVSEDQSIKKTTDCYVSGKQQFRDIDRVLFYSLGKAIQEFREVYPFFKGPFKDMGYNLQRYTEGGYYHWHIDGGSHDFSHRQLVAIWYLNTIDGSGGETEFKSQQVSIKPEEGKLVLFPPFWTHEHRAKTVTKGVKYIATTWVIFA